MPKTPKLITVGADSLSVAAWSQRHGVPVSTIISRIKAGWTPANAVRTPSDARFRPTNRTAVMQPRPVPRLLRHRGSGLAYCEWTVRGERITRYFGKWDSEDAKQAYLRFRAEWATRTLIPTGTPGHGEAVHVCELVAAWLAYCENGDDGEGGYVKRGKLTSEIHAQRSAANYLAAIYGESPVTEFGPDQLRAVRRAMLDNKLARRTINGYQTRIVQMFGWGVGRSLVPAAVWHTLQHVGRLQKGKTTAKERAKKKPVAWTDVEAVLPHLHTHEGRRAILTALVRLHWHLGGRPQDLVSMRPGDIDRTSSVWRYTVDGHKNEHREQGLAYWIGPKAQAVLGPLLDGLAPDARVFVYPPRRKNGKAWPISRSEYGRKVRAACQAAQVAPWTPHQLRHSKATEVMRLFESDDAVAAAIGDTPEVARQIYVDDPRSAVARRIALATG